MSSVFVFDEEDAIAYGHEEAIVLYKLKQWIQYNRHNRRNYRDGRTWTYNSYEAWQKHFPFFSVPKIRRVLASLEKQGVIVTACYNAKRYDKTKWYALAEESSKEKKTSTPSFKKPSVKTDSRSKKPLSESTDQYQACINMHAQETCKHEHEHEHEHASMHVKKHAKHEHEQASMHVKKHAKHGLSKEVRDAMRMYAAEIRDYTQAWRAGDIDRAPPKRPDVLDEIK